MAGHNNDTNENHGQVEGSTEPVDEEPFVEVKIGNTSTAAESGDLSAEGIETKTGRLSPTTTTSMTSAGNSTAESKPTSEKNSSLKNSSTSRLQSLKNDAQSINFSFLNGLVTALVVVAFKTF